MSDSIPAPLASAVERLLRWAQPRQRALRLAWQGFGIGVIGLNSYLMLLNRTTDIGLKKVVLFGLLAYAAVFCFLTVWLRREPHRRRRIAQQIKTLFRLIYTALYLTTVMLDVLAITARPDGGGRWMLVYYGWLFLGMGVWGTNCLWGPRAFEWLKGKLARAASGASAPLVSGRLSADCKGERPGRIP